MDSSVVNPVPEVALHWDAGTLSVSFTNYAYFYRLLVLLQLVTYVVSSNRLCIVSCAYKFFQAF